MAASRKATGGSLVKKENHLRYKGPQVHPALKEKERAVAKRLQKFVPGSEPGTYMLPLKPQAVHVQSEPQVPQL